MSAYPAIFDVLISLYGEPTWRQHLSPVDELVNTILSQNTNDVNRDVAFARLKERFGSWDALLESSVDEIVDAIRPAGLANQKGPRIQHALRTLKREQGEISLDFLSEMSLEDAKAWLVALPGVGPKTAAIVLLFGFGRAAFPVDTHVHRVTGRLGLIPAGLSAEKAHVELARLVPPEHYYPLHLNLIHHGRQVCQARKPRCEVCRLSAYCDYYQALNQSEAA